MAATIATVPFVVYMAGVLAVVLFCLRFFSGIEDEEPRDHDYVAALEPVDIPNPRLGLGATVVIALLWPAVFVVLAAVLFFVSMCEFYDSL